MHLVTLPALQPDLVADGLADALSSLRRHSLGHSDGSQPPGLRTEDATGDSLLVAVVQQELRNLIKHTHKQIACSPSAFLKHSFHSHRCTCTSYLGGFSRASLTHDQHYLVLVDGLHNLLLPLVHRQGLPKRLQLRRASP